jgi:hypothetical protein
VNLISEKAENDCHMTETDQKANLVQGIEKIQFPEELHMPLLFNDEADSEESR